MKKLISVILSAILLINTFAILPVGGITAQAADYAATLRSKGFPESYIEPLVELHKKYPNWIFEPFNTGLDWNTAVKGERSTHSKQLIEKYSGNDSSMYCNCAKCYKNGNYVIQEASNWVSASQKAVEYYMDPRNFLNEKHIFQFESTEYNGTQSQEGVEAILNGTWMHDSVISYKNTSGKTVSFKSKKYSDAIMEASNDSGLSAYYIASKIRQENGRATATATAVRGDASPFQGIYNYYNIGAYTGAMDGLEWAAGFLRTNKSTTLYSSYDSSTKKAGGTKTAVASSQYMTWRANAGDYYYVRLYNGTGANAKEGKSGYILKSDLRTTYTSGKTSPGWSRPWYTPYLSIYYGAKYIASNYKYQPTGYLQKFNVNTASNELYSHEYMANVQAAASEAATTYNAYKNAGILGMTKTFSIPVFKNMPNEDGFDTNVAAVKNLKVTGYTNTSTSLSWDAVKDASGYQVQVFRSGGWTNYSNTSSTKITVTGLITCGAYLFRVRAYKTYSDNTYYGNLSNEVYQVTRANKISGFKAESTSNSVTLTWNAEPRVTGYRIYKYDETSKSFNYYKTVLSGTTTFTDTNLESNKSYQYEIIGYRNYRDKMYFGYGGVGLTASTSNMTAPTLKVTGFTNTTTSLSWNAVSGANGYKVQVFRSGGWTDYADTKSTSIKVSGLITCGIYLFRVQAYANNGSSTCYSDYSNEAYQVTRANKIGAFKMTQNSNDSITMTWKAEPRVTGYRIYKYDESTKTFNYYKTVPSGTTTFTDTGLKKGTTYKYEIIGYRTYKDKMHFGYGGVGLTATTSNIAAPTLKVTGFTNTTTSLSWNAVSGAKGYKVQVFRSGAWTDYADTKSTSIKVSGLITCGIYLFRVQAYTSTSAGPYSNEAYQVTRANKIKNFKVTGTTSNSVTMTWSAEPRVTGYRIYKYNESTKTFNYYKTIPSGTTTFTDTGLKKGTTYKYEIIGYRTYKGKMHFGYGGVGLSATTK